MAFTGKVQLWEGKVLRDTGKVATHEDCCCGWECVCTEAEPNATISGGVGEGCGDYNGEHVCKAFYDQSDYGICQWKLGGPLPVTTDSLVLAYCGISRGWCAWLPGFGETGTCDCKVVGWYRAYEKIAIECVEGNLQGTFTLTGNPEDCPGQTVTVVLS